MMQKQLGLDPANTVDTATKAYVDAALVNGHHLATIGDGAETSFEITHNLGFDDVLVQLREVSSGDIVSTDITIDDENTITLTFQDPPDTNSLRVLVVAPGITSISSAAVTAITDYLTEQSITFTDEGDGEGHFNVGGVPISGTLVPPAATWSGVAGRPTSPVTAIDNAVSQLIDVRDVGVVGDGSSHPLSDTYGSLGAAQAVYPAALDLTDEQDWAAIQSAVDANPGASFLLHPSVHAVTNRPIDPTDNSGWEVNGVIENIWPRNSPSDFQDRANVFRAGNIHPYIFKTSNDEAWDTYALNDTTKGARVVTVTTPGSLSLTAGDKVVVRSDTNPVDAGATGRIYDFVQINKVVDYNSGTGVLTLELPMGETVAAAATLTGPTLCVNAGSDPSNGQPWWFLDGWELRGRGKVIGGSPFGYKMGMWRCRAQIEADCQDLVSGQAAVKSRIEVKGEFTNRCLEVKMAAWESTWIVDGVFKPDATIDPLTTITIGEQATGNEFDIRCFRGPEHDANVRMLEDYGIGSRVRTELHDYSTGGQGEVVLLRSTSHLGRPPADNTYDFNIRTSTGKTRYLLIGTDANSDATSNDADPRRLRWDMNARTDGTPPSYVEQIVRSGGSMVRGKVVCDTMRCFPASTAIEAPENAPVLIASITGAPTYTGNTDTLIASYTFTGPKVGDFVEVSMQQIAAPSSGAFGDLLATAAVSAANTVKVYVRNRSSTAVVMPEGTAYWLQLTWKRHRV